MHRPIMGLLDPFGGYNFENMGTYITYGVRDRLWWLRGTPRELFIAVEASHRFDPFILPHFTEGFNNVAWPNVMQQRHINSSCCWSCYGSICLLSHSGDIADRSTLRPAHDLKVDLVPPEYLTTPPHRYSRLLTKYKFLLQRPHHNERGLVD